jgi:Retrotransposon gag protein
MSTKGKGKADDTASVTSDNRGKEMMTPATITTVVKLKKDTLIKVREPAVFTKNRTKFTTYKIFMGLAVWADNKREKPNRIIKTIPEQVTWAASFLAGDTYKSFEPYITHFLSKRGLVSSCEAPVKKIFNDLNLYFALFRQFYGDLNETRTVEQNLQQLQQTGTVSQYVAKFNKYGARVY